ncbi:nuclear transport factor 2 family protein [Cellulophaga sp. BC115SP]|uniref:nuclear transport factor 2 family protein n=1 Tax=Cellulophaga sp. BC115SP TaxID=2683263 RepID=UPI00141332C7|nr:nuclear transport factor 2 family protein [Cellulophaga sp. BC115SP]NBB26913.1 nuclear transport factor 2 family protein [Cellulophaga sp. BC115SP]
MKNLFVILSVMTLWSCQSQKEDSNKQKAEAFVKTYFEHFNRHDFKSMAAMYVDSADFKDPSFGNGTVKQSQQQTIAKYTELAKMFPDIRDSVISVYPSDSNHIIVEFISKGSMPSNTFELPICTIFTLQNGKITKDFTYYNNQ